MCLREPRHGKSRTAQLFVQWLLGKDKTKKIMTGSYNETVATQFAKGVRNAIQEEKADEDRFVYSDIFPGIEIKRGDGAANLWSLEGGYNNYLATSPTGTATGFGADILIIDDVIKNALEANNQAVLEGHWTWFTNTMLSRLETGGKMIIIMTRWATRDLAGRILEEMPGSGYSIKHINMKAQNEDGLMLCEEVLSLEEYKKKIKTMGKDIALANYEQKPIDLKGRLYSSLKTYDSLPRDKSGNSLFESIGMYVDTADTGDDYLCGYVFGLYERKAYILDVIYTKDPMEVTEGATAQMIIDNNVNTAIIESNNGGRGFARNVKRILEEKAWTRTRVKWFHQTKNKKAKILTNATAVMNNIYFPKNWEDRWPVLYKDMYSYQVEGKNLHDDAQDAISEIAERLTRPKKFSF